MTLCLLLTFSPQDVKAVNSTPKSAIVAERPGESEEVQMMLDRLHEIKAMDMNALTKAERKDLRKEVKAIKQELRATTGIYISIGALIIIILLLILILN